MGSVLRSVLAVLAGIVVACLIVAVVETVGHLIFPPPEGIDPHDPESIKAVMDRIPTAAIAFVLLAWGLGTLVGAWIAARLARRARMVHGMCVGLVMLMMGVATMLKIPHPAWFWTATIVITPAAALAGSRAFQPPPTPT